MAHMSYSHAIADVIPNLLRECHWNDFHFDESTGTYKFFVNVMNKQMNYIRYHVHVTDNSMDIYATAPVRFDTKNDQTFYEVLKFVAMANYGLRHGTFEIDVTDGEFRVRRFIDCSGDIPHRDIIKNALSAPALMLHRYGDAAMDVNSGKLSATEAIELCESNRVRTPEDELREILKNQGIPEEDMEMALTLIAAKLASGNDDGSESKDK